MQNKPCHLFIVILSYQVPLEKIDAFRAIHLDFLQNYYAENLFITTQVPRKGGVIVAKCDSKELLQKILAEDPFALNHLATYEIIEFSPTKWSQAFEHILLKQEEDLDLILEELKQREPIFHHPEKFGKTKQDIENQMGEGFWEVGASGTIYTKQDVLNTLSERYSDSNYQDIWETKDFKLTQIAADNYLLTYTLIQDKTRVTRRSTLWQRLKGEWKILYHQGTIINGDKK